MPLLLLLLTVTTTADVSSRPALAHLSPASTQGLLVPMLLQQTEQDVGERNAVRKISGVRMTVAGGVLLTVGAVLGGGGGYLLHRSNAESGTARTALRAVGWSLAGFGALLGVVGVPLLVVGVVKLSSGSVTATLGYDGTQLLATVRL